MGYFFIDEYAYTEDSIVISNVKAAVVCEVTIQQITNYFTNFGAIGKLHRIEDGSQRMMTPAVNIQMPSIEEYVIEYLCPKSASVALRKEVHTLENYNIHVTACDSLEQPDGQKIIHQLSEYLDTNVVGGHNPAPILTLNDYCLEHICKLLPLSDQINFALSCQRFTTILALLSRIQLKNFNENILEKLTPFQIRIFLQIVGPQLETLTVGPNLRIERAGLIWSFLGMFSINVKKITVLKIYSTSYLSLLVKNMHSLQELELVAVYFDDEFNKVLEELKNLKSLTIGHSAIYVRGSAIAKLTGLEKLVLMYSSGLAFEFEDVCKNLTNLIHLDVTCVTLPFFDTADYEFITKYLIHLRTLFITCNFGNYSCLAELPNLKVLRMVTYNEHKEFLINLAEHQANQLEDLGIRVSSTFTVNDAFSVSRLQNLKVLVCDFGVNDDIIEQFSKIKGLENIELHRIADCTDDGILNLLKRCFKFRRILLCCNVTEKANLLFKSCKLLKEQCDQGERKRFVEFVFKKSKVSFPLEQFELTDVLKVTEDDCEGHNQRDNDVNEDNISDLYDEGDELDFNDYDTDGSYDFNDYDTDGSDYN